jgi:Mn-containing catalase
MFHHVKELGFEVRVARPDPRFATLLQEQFGGANGELSAAIQYFTQALGLRKKAPKQYDMLMDIATEEFGHLEVVGTMITMLLDGLHDDLAKANEHCSWMDQVGVGKRDSVIHEGITNPLFLINTGGGAGPCNSAGVPWNASYINAQGDPTVDLRTNIASESRAKITYEYLKQFTDDPGIQDTLTFLMTREVTHLQQFTAALNAIEENFPPGKLPGDQRFEKLAFNFSNGSPTIRGPWNEGQGPWPKGQAWDYVDDPMKAWVNSDLRKNQGEKKAPGGTPAVKDEKSFTHQDYVPGKGHPAAKA